MDLTIGMASVKGLTAQAFERLRADILRGQFRPAERLRIQALSERYNIGTTAIREALSRLVTDGFVETENPRGFCIAPVSREDLMDLTRTRVEIECLALRGAISHGGIDWEANLLSSFHRLSRTPPPTTPELHTPWTTAHQQFHDALVAGCDSPWNIRLCRLLYDQSERYRNLVEHHPFQQNRDPVKEHSALMEAAMSRDADKAAKLLGEHFWETTEIILKTVSGTSAKAQPTRKTRIA